MATLPGGVHPPKFSEQVKRGLGREATKRPRAILNMMLPPPCFGRMQSCINIHVIVTTQAEVVGKMYTQR